MQNITLDAALLQKNGEDISAALAEIISTTPDNTVLTLPEGRYFIGHEVQVTGKKNLTLRFRGSENQRLIDMPQTLKTGAVVLWDERQ